VIRSLLVALSAVALCACNLSLLQTAVLLDLDSTTSPPKTGHFNPPGAWQIKYHYDCSRQNSEGLLNTNKFTISVYNADDDSTSFENPTSAFTGVKKDGVISFKRGGVFYLVIDTVCDWTLQVLDISGGGGTTASSSR
jgi:hypothetical protein